LPLFGGPHCCLRAGPVRLYVSVFFFFFLLAVFVGGRLRPGVGGKLAAFANVLRATTIGRFPPFHPSMFVRFPLCRLDLPIFPFLFSPFARVGDKPQFSVRSFFVCFGRLPLPPHPDCLKGDPFLLVFVVHPLERHQTKLGKAPPPFPNPPPPIKFIPVNKSSFLSVSVRRAT